MTALKKIHTETAANVSACVFRDAEYNEYRVRFYANDVLRAECDYHTDDKQDAINTAKYAIGNAATFFGPGFFS